MKFLFICILAILFIHNANAKYEVKDAFFNVNKDGAFNLNIITDEENSQKPEVTFRDNLIQVELGDAIVWPKISKQLNLNGQKIELSVYQFNKKTVRVRVVYPGEKRIFLKNVNTKKQNKILTYQGVISNQVDVAKNDNNYDESYLNKLLEERETITEKVSIDERNKENKFNSEKIKKDSVSLSYSSPQKKKSTSRFSLWGYAAKFFGFLLLMVGGIYGAFFMLKKGALKKNKLGFLNTDKQIEVVSKHYLSPKRNLCLVKVHQQVFLVANHENGIEFLSEIKEPGKVLQNVEMEVVGENFGDKLETQEKSEKKFTIKEDINFSHNDEEQENSIAKKIRNKIRSSRDIQ